MYAAKGCGPRKISVPLRSFLVQNNTTRLVTKLSNTNQSLKSSKLVARSFASGKTLEENWSTNWFTMRLRAKKLSEETPEPTYENNEYAYSESPVKITTAQLIHHKVFLGRTEKEKNSRMSLYMLGKRNGAFIYDLDKTIVLLRKALFFLERVTAAGGKILFLGLEKNIKNIHMQVIPKWTPGILTNMEQFSRRKTKGPHTVEKIPDVVVIFGFDKPSRLALSECRKLRIPTVAVIDCHIDPTYFMYPVPGNTRSKEALQFYFEVFREAIYKGALRRGNSSPESFLERSTAEDSSEATADQEKHDYPSAPKTHFENMLRDSDINPSTIPDMYKMERGPLDLNPSHEKQDPFQHMSKLFQDVFKDMKPEEVDSMVNHLNKASQGRKDMIITPFEVKELRALGHKQPRSVYPFLKTPESKYS